MPRLSRHRSLGGDGDLLFFFFGICVICLRTSRSYLLYTISMYEMNWYRTLGHTYCTRSPCTRCVGTVHLGHTYCTRSPCPKCAGTHHHHLSLNREGRGGTTDDLATSLFFSFHFPLFSAALWDLPNSRLVHSLMLFVLRAEK